MSKNGALIAGFGQLPQTKESELGEGISPGLNGQGGGWLHHPCFRLNLPRPLLFHTSTK